MKGKHGKERDMWRGEGKGGAGRSKEEERMGRE